VEERTYRYYETQYKIIRSRVVLEKVVNQLGIVGNNSQYKYSQNQNILFKWLSNFSIFEKLAENKKLKKVIQLNSVDDAVTYLSRGLRLLSSDETELLEMNFSSPNRQFSADVVNKTAVAYQDYIKRTKVKKVDQASSWLEKQLVTIKSELTEAELELQQYRAEQGTFGTQNLGNTTQQTLASLDAAKVQAQANYSAIAKRYGSQHPKRLEAQALLSAAQNAYLLGNNKAMSDRSKEFEMVRLEEKVESSRGLYNMFLQRYQEANKSTDVQLNDSTIVDFARPAIRSTNMTGMKTIFIYILLGLFSCISLIILRFYFDPTFKSHHKLEKQLGLSVLGIIPKLSKRIAGKRPVPAFYRKKGCVPYTENVNKIRTALEFSKDGNNGPKVVQLTSSIEGEGKSTLSYNLALSCAHMGMRTIIVDADMRRPQLHYCGVKTENSVGLSDWLRGKCELAQTIRKSKDNDSLRLITAGSSTQSPLELLSSKAMSKLIEALGKHYDCVIIDSPPILPVADSLEIAKLASSILLVVESGRTEGKVLQEAFDLLADNGITPLGTVLSKVSEQSSEYYYPRTSYGYSYT